MAIRLCVLDMAGTTVAVTDFVPDALIAAFAEIDVDVPSELIASARGRSKLDAIEGIVRATRPDIERPEAIAEELHERFKELLLEQIGEGVQPIPGAVEAMRWLRARDIRVALTTGFDRPTTYAMISRLGWADGVADVILCADDVENGRPAPDLILRAMERTGVEDPGSVVVVGDTAADLEAGRRAGSGLIVGVLSGAHGRAELGRFAEAVIVASVTELPGLL